MVDTFETEERKRRLARGIENLWSDIQEVQDLQASNRKKEEELIELQAGLIRKRTALQDAEVALERMERLERRLSAIENNRRNLAGDSSRPSFLEYVPEEPDPESRPYVDRRRGEIYKY
ncbi:Uncharacterised protein [uncultured archaeon]|nr:Uncharacterised protein [uncultured archaeon]